MSTAAEHRCDTGHFDRTICPEPCGTMHSYCATCGERQDACAHERPMTTEPAWESVDDATGSLLDLVADEGHPSADYEWDEYVRAVRHAAYSDDEIGRVDPNRLRELVRGVIAPRRIGAFTNRALGSGLLVPAGEYVVSKDKEGRNGGKPCRVYRLGVSA